MVSISTTPPKNVSIGSVYFNASIGSILIFDGLSWVPMRSEPLKCQIVDFYPSRVEPSWWSVEFDRINSDYFHILDSWLNENDIWYWWAGDEDGIFEFKNKEDAMMFYLAFK